jgi:hypothetical protein
MISCPPWGTHIKHVVVEVSRSFAWVTHVFVGPRWRWCRGVGSCCHPATGTSLAIHGSSQPGWSPSTVRCTGLCIKTPSRAPVQCSPQSRTGMVAAEWCRHTLTWQLQFGNLKERLFRTIISDYSPLHSLKYFKSKFLIVTVCTTVLRKLMNPFFILTSVAGRKTRLSRLICSVDKLLFLCNIQYRAQFS